MKKKLLSIAMATVLAFALTPAVAFAAPLEAGGSAITEQANTASTVQIAAKKGYVIKTADYQFKIPKYWRGKVVWETVKYTGNYGAMNGVTCYHTSIYVKGHYNDSNYYLAGVSSTRTYGIGPGLDFTSFYTGKKQKGDKVVNVTGRNWPFLIWVGKNLYPAYTQNMSKKHLNKMAKLSTGGKATYKKSLKSVKLKKALFYNGPKKTSKYAKTAQKWQYSKLVKSLKVR